MTKTLFTFRLLPGNRFTLPLLLSIIENSRWSRLFNLSIAGSARELLNRHTGQQPGIAAYSFMTTEWPVVWRELRRLKPLLPDTLFIAGGPHPTGNPDSAFKTGFHTIFHGEAEKTLPRFCNDYLNRPESVQNSIYRQKQPVDIDSYLPVSQTFDFIPPLEITRGCHYRCSFCQTGQSGKPIYRSLESVKAYLASLKSLSRTSRTGYICPSGFEYGSEKPGSAHPGLIENLLAMTKQAGIRYLEYGIFPSEVRPGTVKKDLLKLIQKYCSNRKITLGAQSGTNRMLHKIRRGHTTEAVEESVALIREHGFTPVVDLMIGLPGETPEDRLRSLDWIQCLNNRYQIRCQMHHFIPLSGTVFEHSEPSPLDRETEIKLDRLHRGGICTNWWEKGREMAIRVVRLRNRINGSQPE